MIRNIIIFLTLYSLLSCQQNGNKAANLKNKIQTFSIDTIKQNIDNTNNIILEKTNTKVSLDTLIPIEILKEQSKNVYKKYGLEFTGNCYACDLAEFRIENKKVIIYNVCDANEYVSFNILELKNTAKRIEIKTEKCNFTFLRVEYEPIFKLKIINYNIINKHLRISKFYTFKENLKLFESHDCGDFEG